MFCATVNPERRSNKKIRENSFHQQLVASLIQVTKIDKHRNVSKSKLPPIKRRDSNKNENKDFNSTKFNETSFIAALNGRRSTSQMSIRTDLRSEAPSRSRTPTKKTRLIPLKFGHPVKLRSSSFYEPTLTKKELRLRENSFVNDAISSSHKNRQYPTIPVYDALKDPYLVTFPLSRFVHKAFQISNEQRPIAKSKHPLSTEHLRIVAKSSSGYGKLNGYDCFPSNARRRRNRRTSETNSFKSFSVISMEKNSQ